MSTSLIEDFDAIAQRLRELEREKAPKQETPIVINQNPPEFTEVDPWGFFGDGCC